MPQFLVLRSPCGTLSRSALAGRRSVMPQLLIRRSLSGTPSRSALAGLRSVMPQLLLLRSLSGTTSTSRLAGLNFVIPQLLILRYLSGTPWSSTIAGLQVCALWCHCYTVLNGFQLPWTPSCFQKELTSFLVSAIHHYLSFGNQQSRIEVLSYYSKGIADLLLPRTPLR